MAEIVTPWGYTVKLEGNATAMPPILSVQEFRTLTGNRLSSTDEVVAAKLAAVSSAVRDWCGWHVAPSLTCSCALDGGPRAFWLPCMGVMSVDSVEVSGEPIEGYEWAPRGELLLPGRTPRRLRAVEVEYVAGFSTLVTQALAQAVAQIAANDLAAVPGVREEHAGDVGATYNMTASGVSGGVRLLASDCAALAPYRIHTA